MPLEGAPGAGDAGARNVSGCFEKRSTNSRSFSLTQAALDYAAAGLAVFPCLARGKMPAIAGGFRAATADPETVARWWRHRPDCNVGVATGQRSGCWVLDIDGPEGAESLWRLESKHGLLPPTLLSRTARGTHIWLRYTEPIPSSTGRVGPGLDVRGDGGYVLAPPSIHPTGVGYAWNMAHALADAPAWLALLARTKPAPKISERALATSRQMHPMGGPGAYGAAVLNCELASLANAGSGTRNATLNRTAFRLFQLVAGGELDGGLVRERLIEACHSNGLIHDDGIGSVIRTIQSGAAAGLSNPRRRAAR